MENNSVTHPSHYTEGDVECIDAIRASMSLEQFTAYCKGNVMKYLWRWEKKAGLEDLRKAQVYLGWMVEAAQERDAELRAYAAKYFEKEAETDS